MQMNVHTAMLLCRIPVFRPRMTLWSVGAQSNLTFASPMPMPIWRLGTQHCRALLLPYECLGKALATKTVRGRFATHMMT